MSSLLCDGIRTLFQQEKVKDLSPFFSSKSEREIMRDEFVEAPGASSLSSP
jgi:hypothetical protein